MSSDSSRTPRFLLVPSHTLDYVTQLAKCAEHKLAATGLGPLGPLPWHSFLPHANAHNSHAHLQPSGDFKSWALELANPLAHDLRGGLGAELLACQTALDHPQRTNSPHDAEVVLVRYRHSNPRPCRKSCAAAELQVWTVVIPGLPVLLLLTDGWRLRQQARHRHRRWPRARAIRAIAAVA
jgi:hypothetical protein